MKYKDKIKINEIEWICFNEKEQLFTTTDVLSKEVIENIIDGKRLATGNEVRYNNDITDDSWENSTPRRILNNVFLEKYLDKTQLNKMNEDYVRLLTKEEVENLDNEFHDVNGWYWTMTSNTDEDDFYASVFGVGGDGYLYSGNVSDTHGVRPVISLKYSEFERLGLKVDPIAGEIKIDKFERTKKIEKITIKDNGTLGFPNGEWTARNMDKAFAFKINELIDKVNELMEDNYEK